MSIASTGCLKSSTVGTIVDPLWDLDNQNDQHRDYVVDDFTMEALMEVHRNNPIGLLVHRDELDGFFKSANKYRGGKGDDSQRWLSLYNGKSIKVNRKGNEGDKLQLKRTAVSITGTIQRRILDNYLQGDNIDSGAMARWLLCFPKMPSAKHTWKEVPDVSGILTKLYLALDRISIDSTFRFSNRAKDCFVKDWNDPIVERTERESNAAMEAMLAKSRGYCARIALIIHCIEESCKLEDAVSGIDVELPLELEISSRTVEKAISLSKYYIAQAELVYGIRRELENSLPEVWVILEKLSKEKGGWIKLEMLVKRLK